MNAVSQKTLAPMSMEDLKQRGYKNSRHNGLLCLWFVDGLGEAHYLVRSEIEKFGLDKQYPRYMKANLGIKTINRIRAS